MPRQAPCHPLKEEPAAAVAWSLTRVLDGRTLLQLAVQLATLPAGEKVTLPWPVPALV